MLSSDARFAAEQQICGLAAVWARQHSVWIIKVPAAAVQTDTARIIGLHDAPHLGLGARIQGAGQLIAEEDGAFLHGSTCDTVMAATSGLTQIGVLPSWNVSPLRASKMVRPITSPIALAALRGTAFPMPSLQR